MRVRRHYLVGKWLSASGFLVDQLAKLEQIVQSQQVQVAAQQEEIERLRGELASLTALEGYPGPLGGVAEETVSGVAVSGAPPRRSKAPSSRSTSRRALLRLGGMGAATGVVAAAAGWAGHVPVAHASGGTGDGTAVVQGTANPNTSSTGTILQPVASTSPVALLTSDNSSSGSKDTATSGLTALGPANTNGVIGIGNGSGGYGVWGRSDAGVGLVGESTTGIDIGAVGTGRLHQLPQVFSGAPSGGSYTMGEQIRDAAGELWICVKDGSPGVWRRVTATRPGFTGGATNLLPAPIRIFDTRVGQPAPLPNPKGRLASRSTTPIQVTGTVVGGLSVPAGAVAVIGNLTVTDIGGPGNLILYPHGAARPLTSNINFVVGSTVANFAIVGLSADGRMDAYVSGAPTDALFDVAGFIM